MAEQERENRDDTDSREEFCDAELHMDAKLKKTEGDDGQDGGDDNRDAGDDDGGRTPVQEANRMRGIQAVVTVAAILLAAFFVFKSWSNEEGFYIKIPGKEGIVWECTGADEERLEITFSGMEEGDFVCRLSGMEEGEAWVDVVSFREEDPEIHLEERTYHLMVTEDGSILQKSVERTVLED